MTREEKCNLLNELLEYEEKNDIGLLTRAERREFQQWISEALEQEPKIGHWIPIYGNVKCSVCGSVKDSREVGRATHYCDFCGAKMESEGT